MIINEFAESRTEEKNMEEKQIQIPDVNAGAEERDNYTLIQETPEDDLPGENGIAIRYSKDFNIVQANELLRSKQSDLTLMESKLIRLAVSQIMKGDKDLRTYKVNVSQLAEFLEVPKTKSTAPCRTSTSASCSGSSSFGTRKCPIRRASPTTRSSTGSAAWSTRTAL